MGSPRHLTACFYLVLTLYVSCVVPVYSLYDSVPFYFLLSLFLLQTCVHFVDDTVVFGSTAIKYSRLRSDRRWYGIFVLSNILTIVCKRVLCKCARGYRCMYNAHTCRCSALKRIPLPDPYSTTAATPTELSGTIFVTPVRRSTRKNKSTLGVELDNAVCFDSPSDLNTAGSSCVVKVVPNLALLFNNS